MVNTVKDLNALQVSQYNDGTQISFPALPRSMEYQWSKASAAKA